MPSKQPIIEIPLNETPPTTSSKSANQLCQPRLPAETIETVWSCIEAASFLRLHPKTVERMARMGQIPGRRLGRRWFFRPSDLDAMLRSGVSSSEKANRVAPQLSS
jgi:excisionase family DNA binding protein